MTAGRRGVFAAWRAQRMQRHRGPGQSESNLSTMQGWPFYPLLVVAAGMFAFMTDAFATVESLPRPLFAALTVTIVTQLLLSGVLRSRHVGAYVTACVGLAILGWPIVAVVLTAIPATVAMAAWVFRRARSSIQWPRVTEFLNVVAVVLLAISVGVAWTSGALAPIARSSPADLAVQGRSGPDIYLILLDGHPRGDIMVRDFGLDVDPFLGRLERLGFEVSSGARSNYNFTILTLTSMFNMSQIRDIEGLDAGQRAATQFRQLARAMNAGGALRQLRERGYEIVTVPSPAGVVTLHSADRLVGGASITQFEFETLMVGVTPLVLPDVQRTLVMGSLRGGVLDGLNNTVALAQERTDRPKFVFTHVMSPHTPVLFAEDGQPVDGWPCYPQCSPFDSGWRYGDEAFGPIAGQIEYLDRLVVDTVERILAASPEPPVIILFSDHGARHRPDDRDEMVKSLMVAFTPGRGHVFPDDSSPVNLFPRLFNAYFAANLPLSSEETYTIELAELLGQGPLNFEPKVGSGL